MASRLVPAGAVPAWAGAGLEELRRNWRWVLALGIVLIVLGVLALGAVAFTTLASVLFFGWLLVVSGILIVVQAFSARGWGGFFLSLLSGILHLIVGFIIVTNPAAGALTITLLLAGFFLVAGFLRLGAALVMRFPGWPWAALSGGLAVLLGLLIWSGLPGAALWVIGLFVAIELLSYGVSLTMLGLALRRMPERDPSAAAATATP